MTVNMNLGLTKSIIRECKIYGAERNQVAYILATAYWESGRTMMPVKEAFWLSESFRNNLRYAPWYGRGLVQLTWKRNYQKAGEALGVDLVADPDLAMDPSISTSILVLGMIEGWFTGKRLQDYVTLKTSNFVGARRVVNGTDKAQAISEIAREYDAALLLIGYGVTKVIPVVNQRRDGTQPRENPMQSTSHRALSISAVGTLAGASDKGKELVGNVTETFGVSPQFVLAALVMAGLAWAFRQRLKRWADGDR